MLHILGFILLFSSVLTNNEPTVSDFSGTVIDAVTMHPVPYAYLHLEEINRSSTTGREGTFRFQNIPSGTFTLHIHRIGYETRKEIIQIKNGVEKITLFLVPQVIRGSEVVVLDDRDGGLRGNLEHASVKILGQDLRRNLGTTLSQTLQNTAGMSEQSMGPAPGRPVIRGLDGERVIILRDGVRSGDVSTTSPDHAVTIDPMLAEEIQIARGPAALVYGGNAVGGVINVVQNLIPTSVPTRTARTLSLQGRSVNSEASIAGQVSTALGDHTAARFNLNGRLAQDMNAPSGTITNTWLQSLSGSGGVSIIKPWGYVGGALSAYFSEYGIPPDAEAGHPDGVDIIMQQYSANLRGEYLLKDGFFTILEPEVNLAYYNHQEIEANGSVGTEYDQWVTGISFKGRHQPWSIFDSGIIGTSVSFTDYRVFGTRTPATWQLGSAIYVVQEADIGSLHLELGTRLDYEISAPYEERNSPIIGQIEQAQHIGLSSSISAIYNMFGDFYAGATLLHSFRAPSLEELFSEGPHLAAYSFEIGNPTLDAERGFAKELFVRYKGRQATVQLTGYRNYFWNYIYARDTGRSNFRLPELNDYQFEEAEVTFLGAELSADIKLTRNLSIGANTFYTHAERRVDEQEQEITGFEGDSRPLPQIPPFMGNAYASLTAGDWSIRSQVRFAARQNRLGEFETVTKGYELFDVSLQYVMEGGNLLHTFSLNAENIFNTEYRNHLSRVKHIFPEPGRNFSLLYRVYF